MQIRCDIMAKQGKECSNRERFVTVAENIEVYGVLVVVGTEPGDEGVNGYHPQDSNNTV
jgi:hypothetical protein